MNTPYHYAVAYAEQIKKDDEELTDEEIMEIAKIMCGDHIDNIDDIWVILFAREILRKAQEK